jgi:hypothetical protein
MSEALKLAVALARHPARNERRYAIAAEIVPFALPTETVDLAAMRILADGVQRLEALVEKMAKAKKEARL